MCYELSLCNWQWATIWSGVQAIGTPLAIGLAYYSAIVHPKNLANQRDLEKLVGYRNIAWFTVRLLLWFRGKQLDGDLLKTLERCHALVTQIPIAEISAPGLTEAFARIDVAASICLGRAEGNGSLAPGDVDEASKELNRIDDYLRSRGLEKHADGSFCAPFASGRDRAGRPTEAPKSV